MVLISANGLIYYINPRLHRLNLGTGFLNLFPYREEPDKNVPLSPFLFALVMEPLATALRRSAAVVGIQVGSITEKVALYAHDLMLFLNDPGPSLREALQIFSRFTVLSGLRVNWEKSHMLPIDSQAHQMANPLLSLSWASSMHYLGITLYP